MRRYPLIVLTSCLLLTGLCWSLGVMDIDRSPADIAGAENLRALFPWWVVSGALWGVLALLWWNIRRDSAGTSWNRVDVLLIVGVAIVVRVVVVIVHDPALSDDIHRYTFDGRNLAAGVNPYLVLPEERLETKQQRWPGEQDTIALMNNRELYTIYLPASQYVFCAAAMCVPDAWSEPMAAARVCRAVFSAIDMAIVVMLLAALRRAGRSPWWVVLYAWHPLVISEFAGSGHQDVVGIALMVAALLAVQQSGISRVRRGWWAFPLGLAVLVKPFAVVVAMFIVRRSTLRSMFAAGVIGVLVVCAAIAPLLFTHGGQPMTNMCETAQQFTVKWAHFGSVYEPMLVALDAVDPIDDRGVQWHKKERHEAIARWIAGAIAVLILLVVFVGVRDVWTSARIAFLAMVLLSPTAHPWYLLWALVFMPMSPSPAVWVLSLTLPWGYAVLGDTVDWTTPRLVYIAAYTPVYAAVAAELWQAWARRRTQGVQPCTRADKPVRSGDALQ